METVNRSERLQNKLGLQLTDLEIEPGAKEMYSKYYQG